MPTAPARLAATVAAWLLLAAPAALAQDAEPDDEERGAPVDFVVEPAPGAGTSPGGGWFMLDLEPGAQTHQELRIRNPGDEPVELELAAVDADTGATGGASYRRLGEPVEATGAWITLEQDRLVLGAGETAIVRLTITVPADAVSGDHLAGVAVWAPDDVEEVEQARGAVVAIEQRRVVAVQVRLPGPAEPILRVSAVEPQVHPGGVRLLVHITNEGRGLTQGEGVLQVVDPAFAQDFEFGTFVPGTAIAYPVPWTEDRPPEGEYQARVQLHYGMWTETWEGTFTVGEDIIQQLDRFQQPGIPWWWFAAAAAVVVLAAAGWGIYRLGRRPPKPPRQNPHRQLRRPPARPQHPSWSSPPPHARAPH